MNRVTGAQVIVGDTLTHPGVADVHAIGAEPGLHLGGGVYMKEVCATKLHAQRRGEETHHSIYVQAA